MNNLEIDFEKMSHTDIAYYILEKEGKTYNTVELLKKLCELLGYDENVFESLIGDFYTSLNIDKRFILIDGKWDLQKNHVVNVVVEDELDEYDEEDDEDEENDEEVEDEAVLEETDALEDIDDDLDDDLDDLSIVDEDDLDEEYEDAI